ncbi:MAG: response regulator [Minicystis sp.]
MARVLIIEDEAVLRSAMARGIAKMPGITVAAAATLGAGLESIDAEAPQMIISDIDLPDRPGLELLGELGRRALRVPVLFVSAYLKAYAAQIPRHADVDVREKPVRLDELRSIIESRLAAGAPTEEAPFAPADYLQLACLGHRSVVIEIEAGESRGLIVVNEGTLWTASDERGSGKEAFQRLAFKSGAMVRVRALRDEPGPRTIEGGWEQVLLDAARELDEASLRGQELGEFEHLEVDAPGAPPSPPPPPPPPPRAPAPTLPSAEALPAAPTSNHEVMPDPETTAFEAAFDAGVEALLVKDYAGAYAAFERAGALRPDDPKVVTNLERLRQLGHGRAAEGALGGPDNASR